jgi:hypothetical protein
MIHRAHDYRHLIARWRAVARQAGLKLRPLIRAGEYPLYFLQNPTLGAAGGIYLSAGIHGDEPGGTEALIAWAEKHGGQLAGKPLLIFPCLNPWGLINNQRRDEAGLDLNRIFHLDDHPLVRAMKQLVQPHRFELALMLHEDFDGQGLYLYEVPRDLPHWGEDLLAVAKRHIAIDPRHRIDRRKATAGLIRRRFSRRVFEEIGYPEAIWLHQAHARRALTIETPSEFALEQRIRAHLAVLEACLRRVAIGREKTA